MDEKKGTHTSQAREVRASCLPQAAWDWGLLLQAHMQRIALLFWGHTVISFLRKGPERRPAWLKAARRKKRHPVLWVSPQESWLSQWSLREQKANSWEMRTSNMPERTA